MGDLGGEGLLAAKPADGAVAFSFIEELDRSLWDVMIAVFDAGVYVRCVFFSHPHRMFVGGLMSKIQLRTHLLLLLLFSRLQVVVHVPVVFRASGIALLFLFCQCLIHSNALLLNGLNETLFVRRGSRNSHARIMLLKPISHVLIQRSCTFLTVYIDDVAVSDAA